MESIGQGLMQSRSRGIRRVCFTAQFVWGAMIGSRIAVGDCAGSEKNENFEFSDGKVVLSDSRICAIYEVTQSGKLSLVVCYLCVFPELRTHRHMIMCFNLNS